jgi:crotonobetainyl-CoA:carnitine CoA-transferase CaiB-like acyl-CoA transferase
MTGPRSSEPGYDYVLQGLAGWMDITGEPGGPPTKSGLSLVDFSGGFVAAISLLAAVHAARRDGVGCDCDVSLYDTAISLLNYPAAWHLTSGFEPERTRHSAHPSLVPFQAFEASDGWLIIGCAKEKFWQRLTVELGHPEWADDPRFATFADRRGNRDVIIPLLEQVLLTREVDEWLSAFRAAGIPSGPINTVAQALADPHTIARELVVETEHPRWGTVRSVGSPVRVGDAVPEYRRAPYRNEDIDYVLGEVAGYSPEQRAAAALAGAFGPTGE